MRTCRVTCLALIIFGVLLFVSTLARLAGADEEDRDFYELMRSGRAPEALDVAERCLFAIPEPGLVGLRVHPHFGDSGMLRQIAFTGMAEPFVERYRSEIRRRPEDIRLCAALIELLYEDRNAAEAGVELAKLFARPEADMACWHQFAAGILDGWNRPHERIGHLRRAAELPVTADELADARYVTARFMAANQSLAHIELRRLCELGDALMDDDEWALALECHNKAAGTDFAGMTEKQRDKARAAMKDDESGIRKLDKLIDPRRGDLQATMEKADLLLRAGRAKEAVEAFRLGVREDHLPTSPVAHAGLAEAYARLGRTGEAIAEYRIALDLTPVMNPRPWLHMGPELFSRWMCRLEELCQTVGNPQAMIEAYDKERHRLGTETTAARPALVRARIRLNLWRTTAFMLKNGRARDAVNLWAQWCGRFPDDAAQACAQAVALGTEPSAALVPFSADRADPEWQAGAAIATAAILHSDDRTDEAAAVLVRLSGRLSAADPLRLIVADMLDSQGHPAEAVKAVQPLADSADCEKATRASALRLAIRLCLACGENAAAAGNSDELLRLCPDDMNARRQWAAALRADGRPPEWWGIGKEEVERHKAEAEGKARAADFGGALAIYRRLADEARPSDGLLAIRAAELCRLENDTEAEVIWLRRAHLIDQSRFSSAGLPLTNRLSEIYRARNDIRGLASLERHSTREVYGVAVTLARHGRLGEALRFLEDGAADAPDDYPAYMNRQALASLYLDSDRVEEALVLCNSLFDYLMAMQKFDTSHGLFLARAFGRLGEFDKAFAILDHTERYRERGYDEWIDQARDRLKALEKISKP